MKKQIIAGLITLGMTSVVPLSGAMAAGPTGTQGGEGAAVATGFRWTHFQQVHRAVGDNKTYAYNEALRAWNWTTDDATEAVLRECASSGHWCGVNITNANGSWNWMRLYKF